MTAEPKSDRQAMIGAMLDAVQDLASIAREHGIPLSKLGTAKARRKLGRVLTNLSELNDLRTQWLISQYRATAAQQLLHMAGETASNDPKQREGVRKACVDVLRTNLAPKRGGRGDAESAPDDAGPKLLFDLLSGKIKRDPEGNLP